jgi:hypothetical protein
VPAPATPVGILGRIEAPISAMTFDTDNFSFSTGIDMGYVRQDLGVPSPTIGVLVYTRVIDGVHRLFALVDGVETRLDVSPAIKPTAITEEAAQNSTTLWAHLLEEEPRGE